MAYTVRECFYTLQGEGVQALMRDVVTECLTVAQAEGVQVPGDVGAAVRVRLDQHRRTVATRPVWVYRDPARPVRDARFKEENGAFGLHPAIVGSRHHSPPASGSIS